MAENAFESLVLQVNNKIAEMNTAISEVNAASAQAQSAVNKADAAVSAAEGAVKAARDAAQKADGEADEWAACTVSATTIAAGGNASVELSEKNGAKHLAFGLVQGEKGEPGPAGPSGKGGVTFRKSGTILYIETT